MEDSIHHHLHDSLYVMAVRDFTCNLDTHPPGYGRIYIVLDFSADIILCGK